MYRPIGVNSNVIRLFRLSREAEFKSFRWSLVRMAPQQARKQMPRATAMLMLKCGTLQLRRELGLEVPTAVPPAVLLPALCQRSTSSFYNGALELPSALSKFLNRRHRFVLMDPPCRHPHLSRFSFFTQISVGSLAHRQPSGEAPQPPGGQKPQRGGGTARPGHAPPPP
jgi:hypothetical protein